MIRLFPIPGPWMLTAHLYPFVDAKGAFKRSMNTVRTAVEWSDGELKQQFTSQDFKRKLKVRNVPVTVTYVLSALLLNFKMVFERGGLGTHYFDCPPPELDEYKRG